MSNNDRQSARVEDPACIISSRGEVLTRNAQCEDWLGAAPPVVGKSLSTILDEAGSQQLTEILGHLRGKAQTASFEALHPASRMQTTWRLTRTASDQIIATASVARGRYCHSPYDQMEGEFSEVHNKVISGIAHDINNMLMSILAPAELTQLTIGAESPVAPDIEQIVNASQRGKHLTNKLLQFARRERGDLTPLCIQDNLDKIKSSIRSQSRAVTLETDVVDNLPQVRANRPMLEQLFNHLTSNAVEAMPGGGTVHISAKIAYMASQQAKIHGCKRGYYIELRFQDNGCGIDAETLGQIFTPMFTTKGSKSCKGLGLSICSGIVKHMQGAISVESEVGVGSTFCVWLPTHPALTPIPRNEPGQPANAKLPLQP